VAENVAAAAVTEHTGTVESIGGKLFRFGVRPADGSPLWARLVIIHGYGEHCERYREFMTWMAQRGVACEAADLQGHGKSPGRRGFIKVWEAYLDDLSAFLAAVKEEAKQAPAPLFVLGHSHGGLLVAAGGERNLLDVEGCILSAPFLRSNLHVPSAKLMFGRLANLFAPSMAIPNGLRREWMSSDPEKLQEGRADPLLFHSATPRWYFGVMRAQMEVMSNAEKFRLPLLILAGDADPVADHRATYEFIHEASAEDKSLRILPGQLHELLREAEREETFGYILEWLHDRLHPDTEESRAPAGPPS
jgi:alpha-beta hydrolase superfamily lysophospholipase